MASAHAPDARACMPLFVVGVQGTGESSPDADPRTDSGFLGDAVLGPLMIRAAGKADRAYVPYQASFGGVDGGAAVPYSASVTGGIERTRQLVRDEAARCPSTVFAVVGYSQGSHVASMFVQEIGRGQGVVPAEKIAAVALFADPTRNPGASLFPGAPGRDRPEPAPGTGGAAVHGLPAMSAATVAGGGIGPQRDVAADFGSLTGRVVSWCTAGDLACDAPDGAPILRVVANIVGQSDLRDPLAALRSVSEALAFTAFKTAVSVVDEDVSGTSLASLSLNPRKSLSQRMAEASDPRTPFDPDAAVRALFKVATIGLNAVSTVVRTVLAPENIAEMVGAGLVTPAAGLAVLGTKIVSALPELVPPATVSRLVQQAFTAIEQNVVDNRDLLDLATWSKFGNTIAAHLSYRTTPVAAGVTAASATVDWLVAIADDLAAARSDGAR
ncbi:cutinase family protein [Nocardia panacis]|uniref:cutinase family protein n=1 Tax=Nocardia panacis TaxID=2340916 RepID=UPI0013159348|nr:cutinase family protein [Nocardia panacis]